MHRPSLPLSTSHAWCPATRKGAFAGYTDATPTTSSVGSAEAGRHFPSIFGDLRPSLAAIFSGHLYQSPPFSASYPCTPASRAACSRPPCLAASLSSPLPSPLRPRVPFFSLQHSRSFRALFTLDFERSVDRDHVGVDPEPVCDQQGGRPCVPARVHQKREAVRERQPRARGHLPRVRTRAHTHTRSDSGQGAAPFFPSPSSAPARPPSSRPNARAHTLALAPLLAMLACTRSPQRSRPRSARPGSRSSRPSRSTCTASRP